MKQEGLKERVELLEAGEKLGYPRLGYGRSTKIPHDKRIPAGQHGWETFCAHAHIRRVLPALRIARVLRDNGVIPYHPLSGAEDARVAQDGSEHRLGKPEVADSTSAASSPAPDLLADISVDISTVQIPEVNGNLVTPTATPRKKKGGHKKPPHPLSLRAKRG